jgi:hypothetical protein
MSFDLTGPVIDLDLNEQSLGHRNRLPEILHHLLGASRGVLGAIQVEIPKHNSKRKMDWLACNQPCTFVMAIWPDGVFLIF